MTGTGARRTRIDRQRGERGNASITTLVALVALIAAGALAVDVGLAWVARTQLQNVADSAALAGAANLIDFSASPLVVTRANATAAAQSYALQNEAIHDGINILAGDITFGNWDQTAETFTTPVDPAIPQVNTAVQVVARMDGSANASAPTFLARVLGRNSFDVTATATAYMGYVGSVGTGEAELPIAIDCCKIAGPDCRQDYCATIATPPNACDLSPTAVQDEGANTVSCLEFYNTPEQNACWTAFNGADASVNVPDLLDIIQGGNTTDVGYEPVYTDNGTKTPVIQEIYDRMYGEGAYVGNASGTDRYAPIDGRNDSWITRLPVVECQTEDHCAGGEPHLIVGFVCFEIREVLVAPEKIIKGRFLCDSDPLFAGNCGGPGGTGGLPFGLRSEIPVLVQ
jgi:Flp pilus assembly protein TadG